jgi:hypothetical protein
MWCIFFNVVVLILNFLLTFFFFDAQPNTKTSLTSFQRSSKTLCYTFTNIFVIKMSMNCMQSMRIILIRLVFSSAERFGFAPGIALSQKTKSIEKHYEKQLISQIITWLISISMFSIEFDIKILTMFGIVVDRKVF